MAAPVSFLLTITRLPPWLKIHHPCRHRRRQHRRWRDPRRRRCPRRKRGRRRRRYQHGRRTAGAAGAGHAVIDATTRAARTGREIAVLTAIARAQWHRAAHAATYGVVARRRAAAGGAVVVECDAVEPQHALVIDRAAEACPVAAITGVTAALATASQLEIAQRKSTMSRRVVAVHGIARGVGANEEAQTW